MTCSGVVAWFFRDGKPRKTCEACYSKTCACGKAKACRRKHCLQCALETRGQGEPSKRTQRYCRHCGVTFHARIQHKGRIPQFCSVVCVNDYRRGGRSAQYPARKVHYQTCTCGRLFTSRQPKRYCSTICLNLDKRRTGCRPCSHCGVEYPYKRIAWEWTSQFCSDECKAAHRKKHLREQRKRQRASGVRTRKHRERARRYGVAYEPIASHGIMERDGWKCQLCGKKIRKNVTAPHPLSASLDHIVPMSKGGPHTYANVQAAHFLCNSLKGAKGRGEQLLLIG